MKVELISHTPDPERVIERAYLACRNPQGFNTGKLIYPNRDEEMVSRLTIAIKRKHTGLLEHATATFAVSGVSRAMTHQLVRHRIASYAQLSMRAVEPDKVGYVIPPTFKPRHIKKYEDLRRRSLELYKELTGDKVPLEDARFAVLIGTETQIVITMNFRAWIHFLKLRLDKNAQWEIRELANIIWRHLQHIAPIVFSVELQEYWE